MVPKGWQKSQISDICKLQNGNSFKPHQWDTKGLPIIRIQNLNGSNNFNYYSGEVNDKWLVETGQLLFSWAGTKGVSFGPFIWKKERGVLNQHIYKVFAHENVSYDWLYEALKWVTHKIEAQAHGFKSTLVHVKKQDIDNQPILVPPFSEQQKIAKILLTWDSAISTTDKLIANSKQQKKALMQQLLTGKKRLVNPETSEEFSGGWEEVHLGEVTQFIKDGTHGTHKRYEVGVPMLSAVNITKQHSISFDAAPKISETDYEKIHSKYQIEKGDILLTVVGTLGRVALVEVDTKFTLQRSVAIIRVSSRATNQFLKQLFSSISFNQLLHRKSNSTAQAGVYLGELAKIKLLLPSIEEQQKIATVLTAADKETELLEAKLAHLKQEKKSLMQQLLTGKRRVKIAA
ncbi:restriction endonuclease subunit S [Vibrio splendidus]|uniref:restriction endonuclease subunit S n=1 Tax=Vibrio splendidus TaxID=29497 RepID=UPI00148E7C3E|nr:restriction endonuclease subunit S [Vibrio splendidus]NOJ06396.1 restriction endonuclease subunit S [Vibrio splendidus]